MEIILLIIVILEAGYIGYTFIPKPKQELTLSEIEQARQERIDKSFQELFNYNEEIATRGYKK
jgi:hypothetical protein